MKKAIIYSVLSLISLAFISCGGNEKKQKNADSKEAMVIDSINVSWTAYKTTEKLPVNGTFEDIDFKITKQKNDSATVITLLDSLKVTIPVSSLFSNLQDRDDKIKSFFFGAMQNTELVSGLLKIKDTANATFNLKMNDTIAELPLKYTLNDEHKKLVFKGVLDILNWNGQKALEEINSACLELHKGKDGVSKTWNTVDLEVVVSLK